MERWTITREQLNGFERRLAEEERSGATIEKYLMNVKQFAVFLKNTEMTKTSIAKWKESLLKEYAPSTVNGKLTALDRFLQYIGKSECRVRHLRVQRRMYRDAERDLTREEYLRLLTAARAQGKERLSLLMEAVCATGIRVSEVQYLTVEAMHSGRAEITLKGKIRTILIPGKLSRKQIWAEMKKVCKQAGVQASKVFPHNLRHLFARAFYKVCRDVAGLADVLGHSNIETTRIYLITTGVEHIKDMEKLNLIS